MRVEILPSLTVTTVNQFQSGLRRIQSFAPVIHLDLMDGVFVRNRSISPSMLARHPITQPLEIHAMVSRPGDWLPTISHLPVRRAVLHVELGRLLAPALAWFRSRRIEVGLAINLETRLGTLARWVPHVKSFQVMAVKPGRYGAKFDPKAIRRLAHLRRAYPKMTLACDGGMNEDTIPAAVRAGAHRLIVGSVIQSAIQPAALYRRLIDVARRVSTVVH